MVKFDWLLEGVGRLTFIKNNFLFSLSFLLALISCLFGRFAATDIDFKVILTLLGLMLIIQGFEKIGVLRFCADKILKLSKNSRQLVQYMVFLAFVGSMFLTNDVAVLTLLPIYLKLLRQLPRFKGDLLGAVLIVVAANLGSSFFPFGNPQNLYLYDYYHVGLGQFLSWLSLLLVVGDVCLSLLTFFVPKTALSDLDLTQDRLAASQIIVYTLLMSIMILVVLGILPYAWTVLAIVIFLLFYQRALFKEVDYLLLLTFVCFFIIVGNIAEAAIVKETIQNLLATPARVYLGSIILSQGISNVPAAFLVAPFTLHQKALILGVNVGGLGTLIASLANLIGYNVVTVYLPEKRVAFLKLFTGLNFILLAVVATVIFLLIH